MKLNIGYLQVLASGIGFGFLGVFGKIAFAHQLTVGEFLTYRFLTAAGILWFYLALFKPHLIKLPLQQIKNSVLLGIFGYAVFSTLYFKSIEGLSVSLAAMLLFTFPIFVSLGEHFYFKIKMTKPEWLSLFLAISGMVILLWGDLQVQSVLSAVFGLGAAVAYSIYVLVSGRVQKNVQPISSSLYVITTAAIFFLLIHRPDFVLPEGDKTLVLQTIFAIAIISTIGPLSLFLAGLQKMSSSQASILVMIEPVTAAVAGYFILNEKMSLTQVIGTVIVLLALFLNAKAAKIKSALKPQ